MQIERDASVKGYEITDGEGNESEVIYCPKGEVPSGNPLYRVGFGKRKFIVISTMDGEKRVNRLYIADELLRRLQ